MWARSKTSISFPLPRDNLDSLNNAIEPKLINLILSAVKKLLLSFGWNTSNSASR